MKRLQILIIDSLSQYEIQINRLLYSNKVDTYDGINFQEYEQYHISKEIFYLLINGICEVFSYKNENFKNITNESIIYFKENKLFNFDIYDGIFLTKKGGELWEKNFKPNWNYYIGCSYDDKSYTEPVSIEITSINENLLIEVFKKLNKDKITIEMLDEWEICYWKTITDIPIFKYSYTAESIEEKILIDDIWQNLHTYKDKFCKKTRGFF